ncbi:MAG: hypothetical protein ACPGZU_20880, partial [Ketobacter sp.]
MNSYVLNSGFKVNLKRARIRTLLLLLLGGNLLLSGCGSDDKLPGGTNPGDQDPLSQGTPLFFIERRITSAADELSDPIRFIGGGRLIKKARATLNAPEEDLGRR